MSLSPNDTIPGVVYVLNLKHLAEYDAEDVYFSLVNKGNSRFGHQEFEYVCRRANNKAFLFQKSQ